MLKKDMIVLYIGLLIIIIITMKNVVEGILIWLGAIAVNQSLIYAAEWKKNN